MEEKIKLLSCLFYYSYTNPMTKNSMKLTREIMFVPLCFVSRLTAASMVNFFCLSWIIDRLGFAVHCFCYIVALQLPPESECIIFNTIESIPCPIKSKVTSGDELGFEHSENELPHDSTLQPRVVCFKREKVESFHFVP